MSRRTTVVESELPAARGSELLALLAVIGTLTAHFEVAAGDGWSTQLLADVEDLADIVWDAWEAAIGVQGPGAPLVGRLAGLHGHLIALTRYPKQLELAALRIARDVRGLEGREAE